MRRSGLVALLLVATVVAGCASDDDAEPDIPRVDFTPSAVVAVDEAGVDCVVRSGDPCEVPAGSVIEVRNDGATDARLRGGDVFDTGTMEPGDTMTVVLADEGRVEVVDVANPEVAVTVTVTARVG
jgi:hypothetical protein